MSFENSPEVTRAAVEIARSMFCGVRNAQGELVLCDDESLDGKERCQNCDCRKAAVNVLTVEEVSFDIMMAMLDTINLAQTDKMSPEGPASYNHLFEMYELMLEGMSQVKKATWLGFAQGLVVATGCATLDDMRAINRRAKSFIKESVT